MNSHSIHAMSTPDKDNLFSVLKLLLDSSNWITFKTCFLFAMEGHNVEGHFDGSKPHLVQPTPSTQDQG